MKTEDRLSGDVNIIVCDPVYQFRLSVSSLLLQGLQALSDLQLLKFLSNNLTSKLFLFYSMIFYVVSFDCCKESTIFHAYNFETVLQYNTNLFY